MMLALGLVALLLQTPPNPAPSPQPPQAAPGNPVVVISTTLGEFTVELFKDRAPVSVANFLQYVTAGHYNDTIFHRVIPGFMIQGGGFTASLQEKPTRPPIANEAANGLKNARGTVAMARTQALRSATSQFYVNVKDNPGLDHTGFSVEAFGYAVFGQVLSGMDVVDQIVKVPRGRQSGMEDVPKEPVVIKSVTVKK